MYSLTEEQKKMFYSSGYYKGYRMVFPDIDLTIDNEILHQESVTITQSICGEQELTLGGCIASSIQFEVSEVMDKDVTGLEFQCYMDVEDTNGNTVLTIPMGVYRVDSAKCVDDKDYKKIVAYDALYDASIDIGSFYTDVFSQNEKIKLSEFRAKLLEYLGLEFSGGSYENDDIEIEKTVEPGQGNITGTTLLKYICEGNGRFGIINRNGKFEEISIGAAGGLYPAEDLCPAEDLYPSKSSGNIQYVGTDIDYAQYISTKFEEYETMPITCVTIKSSADDIGVASSDDETNPYVISSNLLFFGKSQEELKEIGGKIHAMITDIVYRPNDTELEGLPYMDLGDWYSLTKQRESVICPVFSRTLKGIQGLRDAYSAKGSKARVNETTSRDELIQTMGKMLEIKKSIDGVSVDVKDLDERESSHFEQTSNQIVMKVDKDGRMVQVELGTNADDGTNYFKVSADNIDLTAEDVINLIAGNELNLTAKKIGITSDNFTVDEDGHVDAKSIDINGGSINLETGNSPESLIKLTNYKAKVVIDGDEEEVKFYGHGVPYDKDTLPNGTVIIENPQRSDWYYDLDTDDVYWYFGIDGNNWFKVKIDERLDEKPTCDTSSISLNSENGLVAEKKTTISLDVEDGTGGTKKEQFENSENAELSGDTLSLKKVSYTTRSGVAKREEVTSNLTLRIDYDESLNPIPRLESTSKIFQTGGGGRIVETDSEYEIDKGVSVSSLKVNHMQQIFGSIVRDLSTDPLPSTGMMAISTPNINHTMPVTVCNGDADAHVFSIGTVSIVPSSQSITFQLTNVDLKPLRINYSYWANV